jgi:hypothetical protein
MEPIRYYGTGRRKTASARVWLTPGSGRIIINGREAHEYLRRPILERIVTQPMRLLGTRRTVRHHGDGARGRAVGSSGRNPTRRRARPAAGQPRIPRGAEAERTADPRRPREGAQEVRTPRRTARVPVCEAIMRVLLVGGGGREHALAWKLRQSQLCNALYAAPGNAGIAQLAECVPIAASAIADLVQFARQNAIDLVVVGPESPLIAGLADALQEAGIPCFGPSRAAAQLEGSKAFAKQLMAAGGRADRPVRCVRRCRQRTRLPTRAVPTATLRGQGGRRGAGQGRVRVRHAGRRAGRRRVPDGTSRAGRGGRARRD